MKTKIAKIIILIIPLVVLLGGFWHICYAQQQLLLNYPEIGGQTLTRETTLPNIIKYIYIFALAAVGIVALLSMLIGAVNYVLSAGNATKASDAKDRIFSAVLGIILLLASVMILRTINPDLVNIGFVLPEITGGGGGGQSSQYPYAQCVISNNPQCNPGENIYRGCGESYTTNTTEARNHCISICQQERIEGAVNCNVYQQRSGCHTVGNCLTP